MGASEDFFFFFSSLHFHRTSLYEQVKGSGSLVFLSIRTSIPPEDSTLLMSSTLVISEQLISKPYLKRLALPTNYGSTEPFSWLTVFNTYLIRNKGKIYMELIESITKSEGGSCTSTLSMQKKNC